MSKKLRQKDSRGGSDSLKTVPFNLRVAETEKAAFAEAAEIAGLTLSAWVRGHLRRAARRELTEASRPIPFLAPIQE